MAYNPKWEPWSLETRRIFAERDPDSPVEGAGGFTNRTLYEAMKNSGVEYSFQLFGLSEPRSTSPGKTFLDQTWNFVTDPAVLTLAGGLAGVAAGGAGAAAGAGSGTEAAATYGSAGEFAGTGAGTASAAGGGTTLADAAWGVNPTQTAGAGTLAEQAADIGGGGSAAVPGIGTEAAGIYGA